MAKKKQSRDGIVYSTDPLYSYGEAAESHADHTPAPGEQHLLVRLDTKHRAGKIVSIVEGFSGVKDDLESLGKKLKSVCGTGGTVKDGQIILQGDHCQKLLQWLDTAGYRARRVK